MSEPCRTYDCMHGCVARMAAAIRARAKETK